MLARRASLIRAARSVIAEKGLIGVTMSDIAQVAGCSYGVVAFHFKSKDAMILAVLDHALEEYEAVLERTSTSHPSPAQWLTAMIATDFSRRAADAGSIAMWISFWAEAARNESYRQRCREVKARFNAEVANRIRELGAARALDVDADLLARGLNAMIDGLWVAKQVTGAHSAAANTTARHVCLTYLRGYFPADFPVEPAPAGMSAPLSPATCDLRRPHELPKSRRTRR